MANGICSVDECTNAPRVRGMCALHYHRWWRNGDPLKLTRRPRGAPPDACSIDGCEDTAHARGWCVKHWNRWRTHGDPLTTKVRWSRQPTDQELGAAVDTDAERAYRYRDIHLLPGFCPTCGNPVPCACCRLWPHSKTPHGYGLSQRGPRNESGKRKTVYIHRWAWERVHGPIPSGMEVMHVCDQPACFYVGHLRLGSHADNMGDMAVKGRAGSRKKSDDGPCIHGHEGEIVRRRNGSRQCLACLRNSESERRRKKRQQREERRVTEP